MYGRAPGRADAPKFGESADGEPDPAPDLKLGLLRLRVCAATIDQSVEMTRCVPLPRRAPTRRSPRAARGGHEEAVLGPGGIPCETWAEALAVALDKVVALLDRHRPVAAAADPRARGEFTAFSKRPEHVDVALPNTTTPSRRT